MFLHHDRNTAVHYTHVDYNATGSCPMSIDTFKTFNQMSTPRTMFENREKIMKNFTVEAAKHIILRSSYLNICISNEKQCFNSNFNGIVQIVFVLGKPKIRTEKGEYDFFQ